MVSWWFVVWVLALGTCLGSFYGVCIYRYAHEIPMRGRSFCPHCEKQLRPLHLIPVISWIFLKGRCAFCGSPIGMANILVECVSGLVAALLALHYGPSPAFAATLLFFGVLIVLSGIDMECYILADIIVLPLAPAALVISVWVLRMDLFESLAGGLAGAAMLFALRWFFLVLRGVEALGLGDVKLMLPLGFICGIYSLPLLLLMASLSGLAVMICRLAVTSGWASIRKEFIPFGPFLAFGCFITVIYGERIFMFFM